MNSAAGATTNEDEDLLTIENIEQMYQRMSKYDPCFRTSLVQYHLKKFGIKSNDERLIKLFSLSFETMVNRFDSIQFEEFLFFFRCVRFFSIVRV